MSLVDSISLLRARVSLCIIVSDYSAGWLSSVLFLILLCTACFVCCRQDREERPKHLTNDSIKEERNIIIVKKATSKS